MTVDFTDYFWGEKNHGFDVLYHNMKFGFVASKEFGDFLRERSNNEENNSKLFSRLAKQAGSCCQQGTFAPLWQVLKSSAERLSILHMQIVHRISDLVKDITKYTEDLHKKHKTVKEEESGTVEVVQAMQNVSLLLSKAKDAYLQRNAELERLRKDGGNTRDMEKFEQKVRKSQEEYRTSAEKYIGVRDDFEKRMSDACRSFQQTEVAHLVQMKDFLNSYADVIDWTHEQMGKIHKDFRQQCDEHTVDHLLEKFVKSKATGVERPDTLSLSDIPAISKKTACASATSPLSGTQPSGTSSPIIGSGVVTAVSLTPSSTTCPVTQDGSNKREGNNSSEPQVKSSRRTTSLLNLFMSNSQGSRENRRGPCSAPSSPTTPEATDEQLARHTNRGSKWFLRSRREKGRQKKLKKKNMDSPSHKEDKSDLDEKDEIEVTANASAPLDDATPELDEEGYVVRPNVPLNWSTAKSNSFYSSSDSDTEDERDRKIHVEIKPLPSNGTGIISASVDELRATVESLYLSPTGSGPSSGSGSCSTRRISHFGSVDSHAANMKRSQSVSQQLGASKVTGEVISASNAASNASTPTCSHPYAPLQSLPSSQNQLNVLNSPTLSQSSSSCNNGGVVGPTTPAGRYSEFGTDIGSEDNSESHGNTPKGANTPVTTNANSSFTYMSIPRPPSRRTDPYVPSTRQVCSSIARTESANSLEFRTPPVPLSISRGPSPLTIGMTDTIPLAVAFHEIVHAYFRGSDENRCQVKMSGEMMLSFPAGIVTILASNPNPAKLMFSVRNTQRLANMIPNKQLVGINDSSETVHATAEAIPVTDSMLLEFNMTALSSLLRKQAEQNPNASYFNVDILKYQIKPNHGAQSCPFQLVAYWKITNRHTDLKIDYKYNSHAMCAPTPLLNVTVAVPVEGEIVNIKSKPTVQWVPDNNRMLWRFTELSQYCENNGVGSLLARYDQISDSKSLNVSSGNRSAAISTISSCFNCEGTTLSGIDFQLVGTGYRVSLVKRRFVSGKYICDGDAKYSSGTGTPSTGSNTDNNINPC